MEVSNHIASQNNKVPRFSDTVLIQLHVGISVLHDLLSIQPLTFHVIYDTIDISRLAMANRKRTSSLYFSTLACRLSLIYVL